MSRPLKNRPSTWNPWVRSVWGAWRAATDAWLAALETASNGWTTEARDFRAEHPAPRFRDFLVDMKGSAT